MKQKSKWQKMCNEVYSCLMSAEGDMMRLYAEYKERGNMSDEEIIAILMQARLTKHADELAAQISSVNEARNIINNH